MILGVGTDIVQVKRFYSWKHYTKKQLLRIFSENELVDYKNQFDSNLEYFASRFAAKEAFYKALSQTLVSLNLIYKEFSFVSACSNIELIKPIWGIPDFKINWEFFENIVEVRLSNLQVKLSISHEKEYSIAFVIIGK